MLKKYLAVDSQIELLTSRGMTCDERSASRLMREGYYAIVNGYGKPFLDARATREAGEDRYLPGTKFSHVYALFSFDRALRMLTFGELTNIEGMLRAIAAAAFLEAHDGPEDYLLQESYTTPAHYLLGERAFERNLRHTISTLSRYANEHEDDERGRDDARLAHYRAHYEHVPLWVVFADFSYGNLYHFIALMRRDEQVAACERLTKILGEGTRRRQLSRKELIDDIGLQVEIRNVCAHGERLFDVALGGTDGRGYVRFARMLERFRTQGEWEAYRRKLLDLVASYMGASPALDRVLEATGIRQELGA